MSFNPVGWFEIYVDDVERAKNFYQSVFNCKLEKLNNPELEMWAFPMNNNWAGASGAIVKMQGFPAGENSVLVYFSCDDCEHEQNKVLEFGGRVQRPKMSIGEYGFISLVIDTEGNIIGLHSQK